MFYLSILSFLALIDNQFCGNTAAVIANAVAEVTVDKLLYGAGHA